MRRPLDVQLGALAYALNGRLSVGAIEPAGLWGMRVRDVEFRPHTVAPVGRDRPLVRIEAVRVRPRVSALLAGRLELAAVRIERPTLSAVVDSDGGPHADWFRWLTHDIRERRGGGPDGGDRGDESRLAALLDRLPEIEVIDGRVSFDDPSGRLPSMGVRVESVAYTPAGDETAARIRGNVHIEGLGRGAVSGSLVDGERRLSLRLLDENDVFPLLPFEVAAAPDAQLAVGSVHVDWPPRVEFGQVRATGLDAPFGGLTRHPLSRIESRSVAMAVDAEGVRVIADDVALVFGQNDGRLPIAHSEFRRPWNSPAATGRLELVDFDGDTATVELDADDASALTARAIADGYDVMSVFELAPQPTPARALEGEFTGRVNATWERLDHTLTVDVSGGLADLTVDAPLLSREPLRAMSFEVDAHARIWIGSGDVLLDRSRVLLPDLGLLVTATASQSATRTTLALDANLPTTPAQELFDALPAGVADALIGIRLGGELAARLSLRIDTDDLEGVSAEFEVDDETFEVLEFGPLAPVDQLAGDAFVWHVPTYDGTTRRVGPGDEGWIALDELEPLTYRALVAAEDDLFWSHDGFDLRAILGAIRANLSAGDVVRGGSTISQQVVKNLFLNHDRTLARKLQEAFLTWQMEQRVSKQRILEYYFNLAHWGPHIYGIRDAAMAYFDHVPAQLTLRESVFLAAILPNPALFGEQYTRGIIPPSRRTKMGNVLYNLHRAGFLGEATLEYHRGLVAAGNVSNTPPPRHLGVHEPSLDEPVGMDRLGSLFFE